MIAATRKYLYVSSGFQKLIELGVLVLLFLQNVVFWNQQIEINKACGINK